MGKIEIDHTGSGSGITLSSDGTDLLLNGTAIGGAAFELYAENPSSPVAPSATGANAVAIGNVATASGFNAVAIGLDSVASGSRSYAFGGGTASNVQSYAIGDGSLSNAVTSLAIGYEAYAQADNAIAIGRDSRSSGVASVALSKSYASGTDSFAAAITNNTSTYGATGANSVAIGDLAKATATNSVCIANTATASGVNSGVFGGANNTASGGNSVILGGGNSQATSNHSYAFGNYALSNIQGKIAHGVFSGDFVSGTTQSGSYVLARNTTDNTPNSLVTDNASFFIPAGTTNQIILPNNSAYAFHGTIVARQQASQGTACAAWKIEGLIRREGSAGTTVLVNSATTVLDNTPAWGMALSADTTNGGLAITVTGAAATNIRWVATIHTSEVTY